MDEPYLVMPKHLQPLTIHDKRHRACETTCYPLDFRGQRPDLGDWVSRLAAPWICGTRADGTFFSNEDHGKCCYFLSTGFTVEFFLSYDIAGDMELDNSYVILVFHMFEYDKIHFRYVTRDNTTFWITLRRIIRRFSKRKFPGWQKNYYQPKISKSQPRSAQLIGPGRQSQEDEVNQG